MTRVFQAELYKLTRRRALFMATGLVAVASILGSAVILAVADPAGSGGFTRMPTLESLASSAGGSEAFSMVVSFMGVLMLVVFATNWSQEFSQATFRTVLLHEPRRSSVIAGKLAGLLTYVAGLLAVAFAVTWATSFALAPSNGISTDAWFTLDALGENARAYINAVIGLSAWACFGMVLGVLIRSTPIALGIGLVWAGPIEHITQDSWSVVSGVFPGLLLESLAVGGTPDAPYTRVLVMTAGYVALAVAAAMLSFQRKDIVN